MGIHKSDDEILLAISMIRFGISSSVISAQTGISAWNLFNLRRKRIRPDLWKIALSIEGSVRFYGRT